MVIFRVLLTNATGWSSLPDAQACAVVLQWGQAQGYQGHFEAECGKVLVGPQIWGSTCSPALLCSSVAFESKELRMLSPTPEQGHGCTTLAGAP